MTRSQINQCIPSLYMLLVEEVNIGDTNGVTLNRVKLLEITRIIPLLHLHATIVEPSLNGKLRMKGYSPVYVDQYLYVSKGGNVVLQTTWPHSVMMCFVLLQ